MQIWHMYTPWIHKNKPGRGIEIIVVLTIRLASNAFREEQLNHRLRIAEMLVECDLVQPSA